MERLTAIVYGAPKRGKTVGLVGAFPTGLFAGPGGGVKGILSAKFLGIDLAKQGVDCDDVAIATRILKEKGNSVPSIVFDDFSAVCKMTYDRLRKKHKGSSNKFIIPDEFQELMYDFIRAMDAATCNVACSMWEQAPKETATGKFIPGCPMMPGWHWPESFPGFFDFVAHIVYDESFRPWPWIYEVGPSPDYITGDRNDAAPRRFPQNLSEILRRGGAPSPRPKGLGWMEPAVASLSAQLLEQSVKEDFDLKVFLTDKAAQLRAKLAEKKMEGVNDRQIRWTLLNALDRANLQRAENNLLDAFIDDVSTTPTTGNDL